MRTFARFLMPIRQRLRALTPQPQQLTLVFDAGASSKDNLESLDPAQDRYVTALRPSDHQALLTEAADHLQEVELPSGKVVRAWRARRLIAGQKRDTVVVFSPQLYKGQRRGFDKSLARCASQLEQMGLRPETTVETAKRKLANIRGRQYLRRLVRYEVDTSEDGATRVRVWSDLEEYRRLMTHYFGLRILITDRSEWSTAQIIAAYRGLSKAEGAFRDLKDPGMFSTRPQFHWTDQKLHVHIFMCVTGYLLVRLLWWRARRDTGFSGSPRRLLEELSQIRCCRMVERTGRPGRPRVRRQLEDMPTDLHRLGEGLGAFPRLG
jgi:transposase